MRETILKCILGLCLCLMISNYANAQIEQPAFDPNYVIVIPKTTAIFESEYYKYSLKPTTTEDGKTLFYIPSDFRLKRDTPNKNNVTFIHLGNVYKIELISDPRGSGHVRFYSYKNSQICKTTNQQEYAYVVLSNLKNTYIDAFAESCGIVFYAEWETISYETDVEIHYLGLTEKEYLANIDKRFRESAKDDIDQIMKLNNVSQDLRILELTRDFATDQNRTKYIIAGPFKMNEGDKFDSRRNRTLYITYQAKPLYKIMLKSQLKNEFFVSKVKDQYKNTNISKILEGKEDQWSALESWEGWSDELNYLDSKNYWELVKKSATVIGAAMGASAATYYITTNSIVFLVTSGSTILPIGIALGAGAIVGGGTILWFRSVNGQTYFYDNGNLVINWDSEFLTIATEAKINYIIVQNPEKPISTTQTVTDTNITQTTPNQENITNVLKDCNVKIVISDLQVLKERTKEETNVDGGKGFGIKDIFYGAYVLEKESNETKKPYEIVGENSIRFVGLKCGKLYELYIKFPTYKPLKYTEFVTKGGSE